MTTIHKKQKQRNANYGARTKFEAAIYFEQLIKDSVTTRFLLRSTAVPTLKRIYLPACDHLQIVEALELIKTN